ncbi:bifunctional serine/threonine-protein kinase/formylglycine-generating enzyme family protein [Ketobacter sp.]|uniref:bifunctional serine/threonine-protein kinase/formylglycine-generating enzyme family protein n=1 Tax=Ketobacter sp. TaxID=2083498 RepID=UPI000F288DBE|nr:bifunctional serine/threonine-protein kinase/formylglycine-generating enzyme family protein [Ketobacter sp.]RLU00547.1 MAG: hypothetical protein D9N14_06390 [Ketobacter sp.]
MNKPVDKTIVQRPDESTVVESTPNRTVVAGNPGLDQSTNKPVASASEGMILKQRFELVELLGAGGMGAVFKARDLRQVEAGDLDPWVAVKVINESFASHEHALLSLQQETKKTQRLSHPNIVSAYDFDRDGDIAFMTMELLQGQSLDQLLRQNKSGLNQSRAMHILRQVTEAVSYAHQQGVVHADLKPANIFVTQTGQVKVLDFGIARALQAESPALSKSAFQAFTPAYASVAVLTGAAPEPKDDLYALGCIFYMLFTGEHPYRRCKATEADAAGLKPQRISVLGRSQWKALSSLLAFQPADDLNLNRFRHRFFGDRTSQSRRIALVSMTALVVVVAGLLVFNWITHREHREVISLLSANELKSLHKGQGRLAEFSDGDKAVILGSAREAVLDNLRTSMHSLESAADYQQVGRRFELVLSLYPDSSALLELEHQFAGMRERYVSGLAQELEQRIEARRYQETDPDFSTLLQDLQWVEPQHPLLQGRDFRALLAREAALAVYLGHRELAQAVVTQASQLFPQDRTQFQQLLQRSASSAAVHGQGQPPPRANAMHEQWLADYRQAVALAAGRNLADPDQLRAFLSALRTENPAMLQVVSSSLQAFVQRHGVRDPEVLALKTSLAPEIKRPKAPQRRNPCLSSWANRGADSRFHCRDSLTASVHGPELVVVKGNRSQPAFAVSRMEVKVEDYNHYCRLYRVCTPRPDSALPVTDLSFAEAKRYAQWLTDLSGFHYDLPTLEQWRLMARDDSGIRDHNCKVFAGGRWIRGAALRPAEQGYPNSLGLKNLLGNAGEWVRSGSALWIAGGDAATDLGQCVPESLQNADGEPSPLRGFRVTRALN